jgi:hypothetical protein
LFLVCVTTYSISPIFIMSRHRHVRHLVAEDDYDDYDDDGYDDYDAYGGAAPMRAAATNKKGGNKSNNTTTQSNNNNNSKSPANQTTAKATKTTATATTAATTTTTTATTRVEQEKGTAASCDRGGCLDTCSPCHSNNNNSNCVVASDPSVHRTGHHKHNSNSNSNHGGHSLGRAAGSPHSLRVDSDGVNINDNVPEDPADRGDIGPRGCWQEHRDGTVAVQQQQQPQ